MHYYIYILFSQSINRFYIGYSGDVTKRVKQHNENTSDKYTGRAKDWVIKAVFKTPTKSDAIVLERFLKKQKSSVFIEKIIDPNYPLSGKLEKLVRVPNPRD